MQIKKSEGLIPSGTVSAQLEKSISGFSPSIANFLQEIGLPTENILSSLEERKKVINALEEALSIIPADDREKAVYLTKFTVAVAVGLFDGALNYLWNETISAVRRLVFKFDLQYFSSVVESIGQRRRNLETEEDLNQIEDHDLLEACRRIGLITDVNFKRLEHVNYMRNHASAAHPNENEIDGFEMLGWLTNCLRYAITASPDVSVISVKRLLDNIRTALIPEVDCSPIGSEIQKLSQQRIDDLLWTIFGMYVDPRQPAQTKTNISNIVIYVWPAASEDRKYEIGARYGVFRNNADIARKDASQEFLQTVDGLSYKDEDSLAGELIEKLGALRNVHFGYNNFYNEFPHAKVLKDSLPITGVVPRSARTQWVKVICTCYVGNGQGYRMGVDESALPYYQHYIENFSEAEVVEFIKLMDDVEFTSILERSLPDKRVRALAKKLLEKSENIHIQRALDLIREAPPKTLHGVTSTSPFKSTYKHLPKYD